MLIGMVNYVVTKVNLPSPDRVLERGLMLPVTAGDISLVEDCLSGRVMLMGMGMVTYVFTGVDLLPPDKVCKLCYAYAYITPC